MSDRPEEGAGVGTGTDPVSATQTRAVHAYAAVLLESAVAGPAADDAIAAFRQALAQRGEIPGGPQSPAAHETLLALTRLMVAVSVPDRSLPEARRQAVWASIGAGSHCTCRESAGLLATRANGNIAPGEAAALDEHLAGCAYCRELSRKTVAADHAFRDELKPKGSGLSSVPRAAYAVLALLVAVGIGVFAANSGTTTRTVTRAAAPLPTQTQTQTQTADDVSAHTVTAAAQSAVRIAARRHDAHAAALARFAAERRAAARQHTDERLAAQRRAAHARATAGAGATPDRSRQASAPSRTPEAAASSPAPTPSASPAPGRPAPAASTAAVVSGQGSLPAESAPQQGIGTLTTTQ